jgi:hypothetical protein
MIPFDIQGGNLMDGTAKVVAKRDIKTRSGLRIAVKDDVGYAIPARTPNESSNWNKVLVQWSGRTRRYWVYPDDIKFKESSGASYVAIPHKFSRYSQPVLAQCNVKHGYHFGHNLRTIRESRGISQVALGRAMAEHMNGVPLAQSTIAYREQCQHSPNGAFIDAVSAALSIMPFVLFLPLERCDVFPFISTFLRTFSKSLCK